MVQALITSLEDYCSSLSAFCLAGLQPIPNAAASLKGKFDHDSLLLKILQQSHCSSRIKSKQSSMVQKLLCDLGSPFGCVSKSSLMILVPTVFPCPQHLY